MVKRAKPRRSQDGRLVVGGMVGLDGGILAAGGESEEVATIRLEVEPPLSSAGKVSQYRAQAARPHPSAGSSHCQCHQGDTHSILEPFQWERIQVVLIQR